MVTKLEIAEYNAEVANVRYNQLIKTAFKNPDKASERLDKIIIAGGVERGQEVLMERPRLILGPLNNGGQAKEALKQLANHLPTVRETNLEYDIHKEAVERIEERRHDPEITIKRGRGL